MCSMYLNIKNIYFKSDEPDLKPNYLAMWSSYKDNIKRKNVDANNNINIVRDNLNNYFIMYLYISFVLSFLFGFISNSNLAFG